MIMTPRILIPLAALAALAAMLFASGCEGGGKEAQREYGARSPHVAAGEALFEQHCRDCHGKQGTGGHMTDPLKRGSFAFGGSKEEIIATILQGRPQGMPAFEGSLDGEQVESLAAYVLWLQ